MAYYSCRVSEGEKTTNPTLNFFFPEKSFDELIALSFEQKRFGKVVYNWENDDNGYLQINCQSVENAYQARSFEDAFFSIDRNIQFIKDNRSKFEGLKNVSLFYDGTLDAFYLADNCVDSKGTFAIDILLLSSEDNFQGWDIPAYIREGLLWLKAD